MALLRRSSLVPLAFGLFVAFAWIPAHADPVPFDVMLVNAKTGKCATIAGGVSTDNNVESVQYDCDSDPSRRWRLNETARGIYQLRNVQTGKCLPSQVA